MSHILECDLMKKLVGKHVQQNTQHIKNCRGISSEDSGALELETSQVCQDKEGWQSKQDPSL